MTSPRFGLSNGPIPPGANVVDRTGTYNLDVYAVEATQRFVYGTRSLTWDGRVFRYSKSHDACDTYKANAFFNAIPATGIDYASVAAAAAAGDTSVILDNGATVAQTLNGLAGGTIVITEDDNATVQQRGIVGNTVAALSAECTIYLDAPLSAAITTADWSAYCMPSPYSAVTKTNIDAIEGGGGLGKVGFCGYAAAAVSVADRFHWEQTWGPISASLYGAAVGKTQYMREVVFRYDGNLIHRGASGITGLEAQTAGFIMDNNTAANGATIIMLQISI